MNQAQAETAITGSALVVGGIYIFRRLSESDVQLTSGHGLRVKQLAGQGPVLPVGSFITGWGFTFLVCALMAQASPSLGGNFAVLIALGAVLGNGEAVFSDVGNKLGGSASATAPTNTGAGAPSSGIPQAPAPVHYYPVAQGYTTQQIVNHAGN